MTAARTVCDRIDAAYAEIAKAVFAKSGRVQGSASYAYIPIGQMLEIVRQAHARAGVKVLLGRPEYDPDMGEGRREMRMQRTNPVTGKPYETIEYYAVGHMAVRILGAGPEDCVETEIGFEARDNSDKLTNKIYTNVERNLYRTLYAIDEGGPDPEAENLANVIPEEPAAKAPAKKPAKIASAPAETADIFADVRRARRPTAVAHVRIDGQPYPEGSTRTMGPSLTGREPEEAGAVHLRDARAVREQEILMCYRSSDGIAVRPMVEAHGSDVRHWSDAQISEAIDAMAAAGLIKGAD